MERRGLELSVGLFLLVGMACLAYLSFKLGDVHLWSEPGYEVHARFSNVAGLKERAAVYMAGVDIGQVKRIELKKGQAWLTLQIDEGVQLEDDVIATIKTMGIVGDKYVSLSPGASDTYIKPNGVIQETQPPLDIENLLGKFVFGSVEKDASKE